MKLTIEPTPEFFMAGDVMVRVWTGTDDQGQAVVALISAVMVTTQADLTAAGLVSIPPPTPDDARRWAETIMQTKPS